MSRRLWIAVEAHLASRDVTLRVCDAFDIGRAQAVGHLVAFWGQVAEDARSGDVSGISDSTLEAWALWDGERGAFAAFIREQCVTDGCISGWAEMQGPLEAIRAKSAERSKRYRENKRDASRDGHVTSRLTVPNKTVPTTNTTAALSEKPKKLAAVIDPRIEEVVAHYLTHHPKRRPGEKERSAVAKALVRFSVEDLKLAIDNNAGSQFHRDGGFQSLELIMRDSKTDNFINLPKPRDWSKEPMTDNMGKWTPAYYEWEKAGFP